MHEITKITWNDQKCSKVKIGIDITHGQYELYQYPRAIWIISVPAGNMNYISVVINQLSALLVYNIIYYISYIIYYIGESSTTYFSGLRLFGCMYVTMFVCFAFSPPPMNRIPRNFGSGLGKLQVSVSPLAVAMDASFD